ncbi:MAG: 30S ribosomal protein S7 [Flavobacteriales bacterium]|nr:30S ribosomal protein S7 [Flavobacteriales bacterium]
MRRRVAKKHLILPDPRFDSVLVTSFVNNLMLDGKKSVAFEIFYKAMDRVQERTEENCLEVFQRALDNVTPGVEVRSRRVGGATFQIPQPIRDSRKLSLAMKWLISFARKRNEKSMAERLSAEVIAAAKEEGATFKKKEDTHRMAEANKAFSHFRF